MPLPPFDVPPSTTSDEDVVADGPDWLRETFVSTRDELRRFAHTAWGATRRPRRFAAAWAVGRELALNPLGFVATAIGISTAASALLPAAGPLSLWERVAQAILPYVYYVAVGVVCHPLLRIGGSQRRLRASLAVALFASGGPGLLASLAALACIALRLTLFGPFKTLLVGIPSWAAITFALLLYPSYLYFLSALVLGLAGLHGVGLLRATFAVLVSLAITGLCFGIAHRFVPFPVGTLHFEILPGDGRLYPDLWF
jgi:hypothetical protein